LARPPESTLALRVKPNARSSALRERAGGWELAVAAPPHEGKANAAAIEALAEALGVPRSSIELVRGGRSREKLFALRSLTPAALHERLEAIKNRPSS
jgi:hypothetical protein